MLGRISTKIHHKDLFYMIENIFVSVREGRRGSELSVSKLKPSEIKDSSETCEVTLANWNELVCTYYP